ncbi:MAG TPA: DUF4115 domain-containing protein [Anaerolineae bacterium]|nr:DUF4115 domain-containing protein [Anaerolineae bacterium]
MNDGLGIWLRRARENQQLSLADVEKALRIRRRYLQALEVGDYTALPGEIQARGFLRNYARFLRLPAEEAVSRYDAELHGVPVQPRVRPAFDDARNTPGRPSVFPSPPSLAEEVSRKPAHFPQVAILVALIALGFFVVVVVLSYLALQFVNDQTTPTQAPAVTLTLAAASLTTSQTPPAAPAFAASADGQVYVRLIAKEHAWVNVSADSLVIFQGFAEANQELTASATEMLIVATGNGGAFQLYVNGADWGVLGTANEVVRRAWGPSGEILMEGQ